MIFIIVTTISISAKRDSSHELLIDPEYRENIIVFDKPNGKAIASIKHDIEDEDFLIFNVTKQATDFFYGTLTYSISDKQITGWVKKAKHIGIYTRNYNPGEPLNFYSSPSKTSKVNITILKWNNALYQVTSVEKGWVFVKIKTGGKTVQGWLSPEMQCANYYTTCN
ncbi:MAG: hypothetical protein ACO1OQ_03785 [Rufibacter sp.]